MTTSTSLLIEDTSQVGEARRAATRVAEDAHLDKTEVGKVAIIATELATNLTKYGTRGRMFIQSLTPASGACIEIVAVDAGPGIANLERSLLDGYSTGSTPGTGLGAVRRLSDEFDIFSSRAGTVVVSRVRGGAPATAHARFRWSAISTSAPLETVCGDTWRVSERGDEMAVMMADGLGHGPDAAEPAQRAARVFETNGFADPQVAIERMHHALSGSRGAAVAMASFTLGSRLRFAGLGNISGVLVTSEHSRGLVSHNGTAGVQSRKIQQFEYDWPENGILVMHSDGLSARWSLGNYPGLHARHPAVIAAVLHRDFMRGKDDASVVVLTTTAGGNGMHGSH